MSTLSESPETFTGGTSNRGRWVVIGMLVLGMLSSAVIWSYWKYRLTPFVPLRQALGQAFPKSSPRAEGGPRKNGPPLLMISLDVKFPPTPDDPRIRPMLQQIVDIARRNHDLSRYDLLEVYLTQRLPAQRQVRLRARWKMPAVLNATEGHVPEGEMISLDRELPRD